MNKENVGCSLYLYYIKLYVCICVYYYSTTIQ